MSRRWLVAVVAFLAIAVWNACSDDVFGSGKKGVGSNFCRYLHNIGDIAISGKYGLFLYLLL